jgi:hypothetical protein
MVGTGVAAGITPAGEAPEAVVGSVLGHTYDLKAHAESCFCLEALDGLADGRGQR